MTKQTSNLNNIGIEVSPYYWKETSKLVFGKNKFNPKKPKTVDLFCGCGGFSIGFDMAGFQTVLGVDIHPPSLETFSYNNPNANTIVGDMRKVLDSDIIKACSGQKIDVVVAGVPCQGFSLCNRKRDKEDERNFLFREFIRVVNLLKPKYVLLENVSGMRTLRGGDFVENIKDAISQAANGYRVENLMLNALDYGVPQRRQRLFFQGAAQSYAIRWPTPTHGLRREKYVTVGDALSDLPSLKSCQKTNEYNGPSTTEYQKLMRKKSRSLYNHEAPNHPLATVKKIAATTPGKPMYAKFKQRIRLSMHDPSPTQVAGGIRPQFQLGHPSDARGLTVRERCRIQSIPDKFVIHGGVVQGRVQTGNAVPPLLAKAIAREIKDGIRHRPKTKNTLQEKPVQMVFKQ